MAQVYRQYRKVVADLLREAAVRGAVRPGLGEQHATVIVGAIEGCPLQWVVDPRLPVAGLDATILSVCLDGLRAGETS